MGGAPKAWIVGAKRHLDHVEQTLIHIAIFNETRCSFMCGHLNWRVVVGGANDEINFGHNAPFIGPVVMRERAARCFDDADSFRWSLSRLGVNIRGCNLWVGHEFHPYVST